MLRPVPLLPDLSQAFDTPLWPPESLPTTGVCYRALRRLPGRISHPLEQRVFQDAPWPESSTRSDPPVPHPCRVSCDRAGRSNGRGEGLFRPITVKIIPMPLYEYQCTKCKHRFERIRKFSDRPITKCPECGSKVEQLISAAAVQFKGSGWYVTDYAKKSSSGSSDSGSSDSGSSDSGSSDSGSSAKLVDKESGSKDSKHSSPKSDSSSDSKSESKSQS